jgi:hypothetical protein
VEKILKSKVETICDLLKDTDSMSFNGFKKSQLKEVLDKFNIKAPSTLTKSKLIEKLLESINNYNKQSHLTSEGQYLEQQLYEIPTTPPTTKAPTIPISTQIPTFGPTFTSSWFRSTLQSLGTPYTLQNSSNYGVSTNIIPLMNNWRQDLDQEMIDLLNDDFLGPEMEKSASQLMDFEPNEVISFEFLL